MNISYSELLERVAAVQGGVSFQPADMSDGLAGKQVPNVVLHGCFF